MNKQNKINYDNNCLKIDTNEKKTKAIEDKNSNLNISNYKNENKELLKNKQTENIHI